MNSELKRDQTTSAEPQYANRLKAAQRDQWLRGNDRQNQSPRSAATQSGAERARRAAGRRARRSTPQKLINATAFAVLLIASLLAVAPVALSVLGSLKSRQQFVTGEPLDLPSPITFDNYVALFTQTGFASAILVTLCVVVVTTVGQLFTSILAAYAFARLEFRGRETIFWLYLATMMVPAAVTVIPLFFMLSSIDLKNTFWGIVLPFAFISPYAIFLLRQFFRGIPSELLDAAALDGASQWRTLWSVVVPNAKPIIVTLAVITFVTHWNNFLWPLIIASGEQVRTMTVAIAQLQSAHDGQWWLVMAATTVSLVPLVIVLAVFHRQLVRSIIISGAGR